MMRLTRLCSAAGAAVLIAACGGGGGGGTTATTVTDPTDQYIGIWTNCQASVVNNINVSVLIVFTATKIDATHGSFTITASGFANASCTPPAVVAPASLPKFSGTVVIDFPASGPSGADKITITHLTIPSSKDIDIAFVNGNQLQFGAELSAKDAQGYPTALDTSFTLIKQP